MQYEQSVLRRLQVVELEILAAIDCVCREYGITNFFGFWHGAWCSASWWFHSLG